MRFAELHSWDVSTREAIAIQNEFRTRVEIADRLGPIRRVAGVDVGFDEKPAVSRAAVVVLSWPELERIEEATACCPTRFPYVPGLLSFREMPAILAALGRLQQLPDLILCDGHGLAHPRRFGIACHLGVWTGLPTIGVGKSRLLGTGEEVAPEKGGWCPLVDRAEVIGAVVRTRRRVKPVYVSIGHRLSLKTAIDLVLRATTRYRLPETTRLAHRLASGLTGNLKRCQRSHSSTRSG